MDWWMIREKTKLCNFMLSSYIFTPPTTPHCFVFFTQAVLISSAIIVISCLAVLIANALLQKLIGFFVFLFLFLFFSFLQYKHNTQTHSTVCF